MTVSLQDYKTWSYGAIGAGILVLIFAVLQRPKKSHDDKHNTHSGFAWAFYANLVVAVLMIVAGGMALLHKSSPTPLSSPATISPDSLV